MANHQSAIKRNRQNKRKNQKNKLAKGSLRSSLKNARVAINTGDKNAKDLARAAEKMVATAATKGIIKKKTASRLVSRMAKKLRASAK